MPSFGRYDLVGELAQQLLRPEPAISDRGGPTWSSGNRSLSPRLALRLRAAPLTGICLVSYLLLVQINR